ncbi:unnamed protein product [Closterium sp. NIES-64]|nr:unnamed protein product [Closterium sp. NIES-64]
MYLTLYHLVTRLPDSLRTVRDQFLALSPTDLTVDLLEKELLAVEKSIVAVGASRGDSRTSFFEGCSPSPVLPSIASAAAVNYLGAEGVRAAFALSGRRRGGRGKGGRGGGGGGGGGGSGGGGGGGGGGGSGGSGAGGAGGSGGEGGAGGGDGGGGDGGGGSGGGGGAGGGRGGAVQRGGFSGGQRQQQQRPSEPPSPQQLREWYSQRGGSGGGGTCPYVIRTGDRTSQTCGKFHTAQRCFFRLDDGWREQFLDASELPRWADLLRKGIDIFALDYDAILAAMYALTISVEGDCYLSVPPDPGIGTREAAALGTSASAALGPGEAGALGASASTSAGTAPTEALHTFTLDSGASRCFFRDRTALEQLPRLVAVSLADPSGGPVLATSTTALPCPAVSVPLPPLVLYELGGGIRAPGRRTVLWHHRLGHPSVQRLRGMHSRYLVYGLLRVLPPLPPSPAPPCLPCVEGRQRAAPHSSSFPPTEAPLQTLHLDVWGPARVRGQGHERYFLLVIDDYTRYTTVFPLRTKGEVPDVLIP